MGRNHRLLRRNGVATIGFLLAAASCGSAYALPRTNIYTDVGLLGLTVTNLGYIGTGWAGGPRQPSGEYPINSNVEHLFLGGLWVGAETLDGRRLVTTGSQDASSLAAGEETREFGDYPEDLEPVHIWSNRQNDDNYSDRAIANQQIELAFTDVVNLPASSHVPLGLKVYLRAMAWSAKFADDFVLLQYNIINISGTVLKDVYVGYWNDTTVGNTDTTNPYQSGATVPWNFYDDKNGAWGGEAWVPGPNAVPGDPNIWMMYEYDADGDGGVATSWFGTRLLGASREAEPADGVAPVSYNAWQFRHVPAQDDAYENPDNAGEILPGKYQLMSNGAFTVGETQGADYTTASDWVALLSTGPFRTFAPNDTLTVTFAVVAGPDSLGLLGNSKAAQKTFDELFSVINGPPSPKLNFAFRDNSVVISWTPGVGEDAQGDPLERDDPARSPEFHLSDANGQLDFQGYRVYRYQGEKITGDPYEDADLIAQFDVVDGRGFDTGLPPLNSQGQREFLDTNLLDGFPFIYSVTSFAAANPEQALPELESGFNENEQKVYPGPAPAGADNPRRIGVYPNPYRAASLFDGRSETNEVETKRRIWFTGLPARCRIQVFNLVGEVVKTIEHDDPSSGQHAWNVLSDYDRVIATGLYIYAVEDLDTGEVQRDKLVIIK
jgi:hypothetical protein